MKEYKDLLSHIMQSGSDRGDRTGTGTRSVFGYQFRVDLANGFPLLTTKKCHMRSIIHELLWFLAGDTNIQYLKDNNVTIWDEWADKEGSLGPVYGKQWRSWACPDGSTIDQIADVIERIKKTPNSRRLIVSAWNPADLPDETISPIENVQNGKMALAACHTLFQFYVDNGRLSCQLYQRSCDTFLGLPFNIASYSLLLMMIAQQTGYEPGEFIWTGGDVHVYRNHFNQVETQLQREPLPLPKMNIKRKPESIFDYQFDDFELVDYQSHPAIKAPISV